MRERFWANTWIADLLVWFILTTDVIIHARRLHNNLRRPSWPVLGKHFLTR